MTCRWKGRANLREYCSTCGNGTPAPDGISWEERCSIAYQSGIEVGTEEGAKDERERVLDGSCRCDLYDLATGTMMAEDVSQCRGESCNWCGRYKESLRAQQEDE